MIIQLIHLYPPIQSTHTQNIIQLNSIQQTSPHLASPPPLIPFLPPPLFLLPFPQNKRIDYAFIAVLYNLLTVVSTSKKTKIIVMEYWMNNNETRIFSYFARVLYCLLLKCYLPNCWSSCQSVKQDKPVLSSWTLQLLWRMMMKVVLVVRHRHNRLNRNLWSHHHSHCLCCSFYASKVEATNQPTRDEHSRKLLNSYTCMYIFSYL